MKTDFASVANNYQNKKTTRDNNSELYFASSSNYSVKTNSENKISTDDSHSYVVEWEMSCKTGTTQFR